MNCRLYLVPAPLGDNPPEEVISPYVFGQIAHVTRFAVEDIRTARRYLSRIGFRGRIDSLTFYEINEHSTPEDIERIAAAFTDGENMALISEAGLPAVADPGAALVALAHKAGVEVVPFSGPSSLMMALMSSGMNGQCFASELRDPDNHRDPLPERCPLSGHPLSLRSVHEGMCCRRHHPSGPDDTDPHRRPVAQGGSDYFQTAGSFSNLRLKIWEK